MASKWKEAKQALGLNKCLNLPKTLEGPSSSSSSPTSSSPLISHPLPLPPSLSVYDTKRSSNVVSGSQAGHQYTTQPVSPSLTPGLRSSKLSPKSPSKKTCAICLMEMKRGQGAAIFTAECSHSFHFQCITINVKHGNRICPICRSHWTEIPNLISTPLDHPQSPRLFSPSRWSPQGIQSEPPIFDDDDEIEPELGIPESQISPNGSGVGAGLEIKTYPEVSFVAKTNSTDDFAVLIHVKAPGSVTCRARAPVDLVTVLDVSGSMAGTKIALLKRAMGFVIQNLGPTDRLSVIAFSSSARRLFPLRLMSESGKHEALAAVHSLAANGGTNIAEGLRKGNKVISDRKWRNPVSGIVLFSDGQDTHTLTPGAAHTRTDYESLIPQLPIQPNSGNHDATSTFSRIPVHTFGFGFDHDAALMHTIAEITGGTFSFIEAENVIQDALAQCIGGLLSVMVQELRLDVTCADSSVRINTIEAGSYRMGVVPGGGAGWISLGDLYAEEERDFLVILHIPIDGSESESDGEMTLLNVRFTCKDPFTKETFTSEKEVKIQRPNVLTGRPVVCIEVERQRNRFLTAQAMSGARNLAELGSLNEAVSVLEACRRKISQTASAQVGDRLCDALLAELLVMQERMSNRRVYETTGRAYVLSSMSSHSSQRATARGDSTDQYSRVRAYQTSSMSEMVTKSQTQNPEPNPNPNPSAKSSPNSRKKLQQALSFPARPHPR